MNIRLPLLYESIILDYYIESRERQTKKIVYCVDYTNMEQSIACPVAVTNEILFQSCSNLIEFCLEKQSRNITLSATDARIRQNVRSSKESRTVFKLFRYEFSSVTRQVMDYSTNSYIHDHYQRRSLITHKTDSKLIICFACRVHTHSIWDDYKNVGLVISVWDFLYTIFLNVSIFGSFGAYDFRVQICG